jgi:hypothetical protein
MYVYAAITPKLNVAVVKALPSDLLAIRTAEQRDTIPPTGPLSFIYELNYAQVPFQIRL